MHPPSPDGTCSSQSCERCQVTSPSSLSPVVIFLENGLQLVLSDVLETFLFSQLVHHSLWGCLRLLARGGCRSRGRGSSLFGRRGLLQQTIA